MMTLFLRSKIDNRVYAFESEGLIVARGNMWEPSSEAEYLKQEGDALADFGVPTAPADAPISKDGADLPDFPLADEKQSEEETDGLG